MTQYPTSWNPNQGGYTPQHPGPYPSGPPQNAPAGPHQPGPYQPGPVRSGPHQSGTQQSYVSGGPSFPPAPPQPNAFSSGGGTPSQWGPSTPAPRKPNLKLILAVVLALLLVAGIGAAAGLYLKRGSGVIAGPQTPGPQTPVPQSPTPVQTTPVRPTPTPTPAPSKQRVQIYQNYSVAMPDGWNVNESNPEKGYVTLQYGQGRAWIYVYVGNNSPPWDAEKRCGYIIENWTQRGDKYGVTNAAVTQNPTKIQSDPKLSAATCAMTAYYVKDTTNVRQYDWQGIYRVKDGLNIWVQSERIAGTTAPDADIQLVRDDVMKTMLSA